MIYNIFKSAVLALVLAILSAGPCFAQNNTEAMRFLMVNAMMQYGQKLYDRGDFDQATAVFNHVLLYNGRQPQALAYLRDMGELPPVFNLPVPSVESPSAALLKMVDVSDTDSLKKAIEAKKQSIDELRSQITQIQANIAAEAGR